MTVDVLQYVRKDGTIPFEEWFDSLDPGAAAKVTGAMVRLGQGNFSAVKGVGSGVFEYRIDAGPGYRIYFGKDGAALVVLLAGGPKRRQDRDIANAHARWTDYKLRKKTEADHGADQDI